MKHLSQEQIASYHARSLAAVEVLLVSDHLVECEECRSLAPGNSNLAAGVSAVRLRLSLEPEALRHGTLTHLTYDQIAAYADGKGSRDEARTVNLHARECAACAAEVRELQSLRAEIDARASKTVGANRLAELWRTIHGWRTVWVFAAAACLLLIAVSFRTPQIQPLAKREPAKPAGRGEPLPSEATAGKVIRDGNREIALSAGGSVVGLDGLPDGFRAALEQALTTQRVNAPAALGELAAKRSVLLGQHSDSQGAELLQPVGAIVETQNPVFRWKPVTGAVYQVNVVDSQFRQIAASGWIREPQWRTPVALRRGVRYLWQLTMRHDGGEFTSPAPTEPEARFRVLDAAGEAELVRLKTAWGDSHLVMGVAYAQAGLLNDARQELQVLADRNPGDARVAALLAGVNRIGVNSDQLQSK